jgi:transposase
MKTTDDYVAFVALDWADKTHAFARHFVATNTTETGTLDASPEALHAWLEELHAKCGDGRVALALEAGRKGLLHALVEHLWLDLFPVHSAACHRFSAAFRPSGAKDDIPDAETLLTMVMHHRAKLRRWRLDSAQTRELAALVLARRQAVNRRTQLGSQLRTALKGYFPQALELIGDNLECPVALDFLQRWPDLAGAQKARPATLRGFYHQHAVRRPQLIEKRLALIASARPLTSDPAVIGPAVMQVAMFVELLRVLQKHVERLEDRVAAIFAAHPAAAFFRQLPGAGPALAPRLLVAFGDDPERYRAASHLQMFGGVAPVQVKSGHQLWVHWRWNASTFLRQTFVEWAGQTVLYSTWARAYYFRQKHHGKKHQSILRALAFKWIRILWRCWQNHDPYDETRYLAALKQRRSPLITDIEHGLAAA